MPGRANRYWEGRQGACTWDSRGRPYFPAGRVEVTGNPVRRDRRAAAGTLVVAGDIFIVFALGGSQGARAISG